MAFNTLSVYGQRPYYLNNNINFVKKKEEDEENSSSVRAEVDEQTIHQDQERKRQKREQEKQNLKESKEKQKRAIASRDAKIKTSTVNIAQILKDFRATGKAIGSPDELLEEVNTYLGLAETQAKKEVADVKIIKTNLKIAASLLDRYISETLQKESKVVENWIEALFLQQINYNFNEEQINPNFLVKFPEKSQSADNSEENKVSEKKEDKDDEEQKQNSLVPQDEELKKAFIQAKKYSYAKDYKAAMKAFKVALDRAIEIKDKETESKILFEIGNIYDKNDYLNQALTSYNKSIKTTGDLNIKTKAHYSMAQIYDDVSQFETAIDHYMTSISYAGEVENLAAQSTSLTKIGNIYSAKYDKKAFEYMTVAEDLAQETKNHKLKGFVSSNLANTHNKFNDAKEALKYYSSAVFEYEEAKMPAKVAINYKRAGELMKDYNNEKKAKRLIQKAMIKAQQTQDNELINEIQKSLAKV